LAARVGKPHGIIPSFQLLSDGKRTPLCVGIKLVICTEIPWYYIPAVQNYEPKYIINYQVVMNLGVWQPGRGSKF
jgi:hypothetical protein